MSATANSQHTETAPLLRTKDHVEQRERADRQDENGAEPRDGTKAEQNDPGHFSPRNEPVVIDASGSLTPSRSGRRISLLGSRGLSAQESLRQNAQEPRADQGEATRLGYDGCRSSDPLESRIRQAEGAIEAPTASVGFVIKSDFILRERKPRHRIRRD